MSKIRAQQTKNWFVENARSLETSKNTGTQEEIRQPTKHGAGGAGLLVKREKRSKGKEALRPVTNTITGMARPLGLTVFVTKKRPGRERRSHE